MPHAQTQLSNDPFDLYRRAAKLWTRKFMSAKTIEECAELTVELSKDINGFEGKPDGIIEELVDVQIMIDQMRIVIDDESKWNRWHAYKIDRLKTLVVNQEMIGK